MGNQILRKAILSAGMLADAGVDMIFCDATNGNYIRCQSGRREGIFIGVDHGSGGG